MTPRQGRHFRLSPLPRWLGAMMGSYLFVLCILSISNIIGPERWWPGSLNLYLPQWLWLLPGMLLLLLTLRLAMRWVGVPLLALLWVAGPLMGFCWPSPFAQAARGLPLRVMTYNVKWGRRDAAAIAQDIRAFSPDLLQMQNADGVIPDSIHQALQGWNMRVSGQFIVASRLPISELQSYDVSFAGGTHHCVRCRLQAGSDTVTVYNVHLLSPRSGLVGARHRDIAALKENTNDRLQQAATLQTYLRRETGPLLLTGDLNAPVTAVVCRRLLKTGLRDAFSEAGWGYGYTYGAYTRLSHPYVRIDHILVGPDWQVHRCWVGNTRGSDHCPVIADLILTRSH